MDFRFICCVVLLPIVLAQGPPPGLAECKEKSGATDDDLKTVFSHKIPETRGAMCFMGCMKKKMGFLNDDNTINVDKAMEIMKSMKQSLPGEMCEKMEQAMKACKDKEQVAADECQAAYNLAICLEEQKKMLGIPANA